MSLRSKSARTIRSGSLRSRQHIRTQEPLRSHRTGLRLLNTDQVRSPARHARRGGIAPRRPDHETHRDRAARGEATRSESDRRVPASGGAKKIRYAISAPQGRLHPVAILFAPKKRFRRRSASRPKRDAPPGAGQGVDGLSRSVSNRQRPQSRISPCPSPRWRYEAATRTWRSYSTPKRAYPCPKSRSMPIINP